VLVKQVISGDTLTARFLNREFFEFRARFKLFLAANHKPVIRGTDEGIWRRIRLIPFTVTIPKAERDRTLSERLRAELPGILAWAVRGCQAWQAHGLLDPPEVLAATEGYRVDMDVVGAFVADGCVLAPHARAECAALYSAYTRWCADSGEFALSQRRFAQQLEERGLPRLRGAQGRWYRQGIGLRDDGRGDEIPDTPATNDSLLHESRACDPVQAVAPDAQSAKAAADGSDEADHQVQGNAPVCALLPDRQVDETQRAAIAPPGIDVAYVRRLLAVDDAEAHAAIARHCALYRLPTAVGIALANDATDTPARSDEGAHA
jgi:phage/plasmid-associated DNA primase